MRRPWSKHALAGTDDELLSLILTRVPLADRPNAAMVCKAWNEAVKRDCPPPRYQTGTHLMKHRRAGEKDPATPMTLSPDGTVLYTGLGRLGCMMAWGLSPVAPIYAIDAHTSEWTVSSQGARQLVSIAKHSVVAMACSPAGRFVIVDADNNASTYHHGLRVATGSLELAADMRVAAVSLRDEGGVRIAAVRSYTGRVHMFAASADLRFRATVTLRPPYAVTMCAFSPGEGENSRLAVATSQCVSVYDVDSGARLSNSHVNFDPRQVAWSKDSKSIAIVNNLRITIVPIVPVSGDWMRLEQGANPFRWCDFTPCGRGIVTLDANGNVQLHSLGQKATAPRHMGRFVGAWRVACLPTPGHVLVDADYSTHIVSLAYALNV